MADNESETIVNGVAAAVTQSTSGLGDSVASAIDAATSSIKESIEGISLKGVGEDSEAERKKDAEERSNGKEESTAEYFQNLIETVLQFQSNFMSNITFDREGKLVQEAKVDAEKSEEEAKALEKEAKEEAEKKPENIQVDPNADITSLGANIGIASVTASGFGILTGSVRELHKSLKLIGAQIIASQAALHSETAKLSIAKEKEAEGDKSNGTGDTLGAIFKGVAVGVAAIGGALIILGAGLFAIGKVDNETILKGMVVIGALMTIVGGLMLLQSLMVNHIEKFQAKDKDDKKNIHYGINELIGVFATFAIFALVALGINKFGFSTVMGAVLATLAILAVAMIGIALVAGLSEAIGGEALANLKSIMWAFIGIVLVVVVLVVIGTFLPPETLAQGFDFTYKIMAVAMAGLVLLIGMSILASMVGGEDGIANLKGVMMAYIGMVVIVAVLVLLLGGALAFLPITQEHLDVGMKNTIMLMAVAMAGLVLITVMAKIVGQETIKAVQMLMLTYIGLLVTITAITIVMGSIDRGILIQGGIAMVVVVTMAMLGMVAASKLAKPNVALKALVGLGITALFVLTLSALAILMGKAVPNPGAVAIGGASLLLVVVFAALLYTACAGFGLLITMFLPMLGLAFFGLAVVTAFTVVLAGVVLVMGRAVNAVGGAEGAVNTSLALMLTVKTLMKVAGSMLAFSVIGITAFALLPLALSGLRSVGEFTGELAKVLGTAGRALSGVNPALIVALAAGVSTVMACASMIPFLAGKYLSIKFARKRAVKALGQISGFSSDLSKCLKYVSSIAAETASAAEALPLLSVAMDLVVEAAETMIAAMPRLQAFAITTGLGTMAMLQFRFWQIGWFLKSFTKHAWQSYGTSIQQFSNCLKYIPEVETLDRFLNFMARLSGAGADMSYFAIRRTGYALNTLSKGMHRLAMNAGPMRILASAMRDVAEASQTIADIQASVQNTVTPDVDVFKAQAEDTVVTAIHNVTAKLASQALQLSILNRIAEAQEQTRDMVQQLALSVEFGGGNASGSAASGDDGGEATHDMSSGGDYV